MPYTRPGPIIHKTCQIGLLWFILQANLLLLLLVVTLLFLAKEDACCATTKMPKLARVELCGVRARAGHWLLPPHHHMATGGQGPEARRGNHRQQCFTVYLKAAKKVHLKNS